MASLVMCGTAHHVREQIFSWARDQGHSVAVSNVSSIGGLVHDVIRSKADIILEMVPASEIEIGAWRHVMFCRLRSNSGRFFISEPLVGTDTIVDAIVKLLSLRFETIEANRRRIIDPALRHQHWYAQDEL